MGSKWSFNCHFVVSCVQNLFKTVRSVLVLFQCSLFSQCFVNVHGVQSYCSTDTAMASKTSCFISTERLDFHMVENLSKAVHDLPMLLLTYIYIALTSDSVDEIWWPNLIITHGLFSYGIIQRQLPLELRNFPCSLIRVLTGVIGIVKENEIGELGSNPG